jgi:hypothetical protein
MSLAIIDAREWQSFRDLRTGEKREDAGPGIRMVSEVLKSHPFPGDLDERCNRWVTDTALDLAGRYDPKFAFLIYAQQFYSFRFNGPVAAERDRLIDEAFAEAERFATEGGFFPIIVGTGDMVPVAAYIDLSRLDGTSVTSHWLTRYAGLYGLSREDWAYIRGHSGIERVVSKEEFISLFAGAAAEAERLPDYLAVAREGHCFRSTLLRQPVMLPGPNKYIPVSAGLNPVESITGICAAVAAKLTTQKVALILIDGVGLRDFRLPSHPCRNGAGWYSYEPGEAQYLTISTGKHQVFAYPAGYKSYLEDDENKEYPFSGYLTSIPAGTLGNGFGGKSIAVGNRSMFMHTVTGADIAIECFARNLANQGCLGVIHRQDKL